MTSKLTYERLREVLTYDAEKGVFYWNKDVCRRNCGDVAGHTDARGYTKISIDGVKYFVHRLAWFYHYKEWPSKNIDHIDQCKNNNRISNLRDVGQSANGLNGPKRRNNTSGYTGVSYDHRRKKWVAYLHKGRRKKHLGEFVEKELAAQARAAAFSLIFNCTN